MNNVKHICKLYGGSRLFHLETPESDIDYRGVFMHTDSAFILGTRRFDEKRSQNPDTAEDIVLKELSHYCYLLSKSNSEAIELLYCNESEFHVLEDEFRILRNYRASLIDSKKFFVCLRGYMQGERRLMNGERKGQIGGKRYAKLQEVGYSPKNAVQLIRLANMGINFFKGNGVIVDTRLFPDNLHSLLMDIKVNPQNFSKEHVNSIVDECETKLVDCFENRTYDHVFNEDLLNKLLMDIYMPILEKSWKKA